jgi:hypothetical protein
VYPDGRVAKLGYIRDPAFRPDPARGIVERLLLVIERSSVDGTAWRSLPRPAEMADDPPSGSRPLCDERGCALLLAADPADAARNLLILREGGVSETRSGCCYKGAWREWWYDESAQRWVLLAKQSSRRELGRTIDLPASVAPVPLKATGMQHEDVAVWR